MQNTKEQTVTFQIIHVSKEQTRDALKSNMDLIQVNLLRIMKSKGISQYALAHAIESEPGHVNYILRKKNKGITIKVLGRMAKALDVPIYELIK